MTEDAATPPDPRLGTTGGELRLWLAKEAVRHGETLLAAQQSNLTAMETRATAIFGWSIPTILALGAAALSSRYIGAALGAAVCLVGAAFHCAIALWPQRWGHIGYSPRLLLDETLETELEVLESVALGYAQAIALNDARLTKFARWLQVAWLLFLAAPIMGGIGILVALLA